MMNSHSLLLKTLAVFGLLMCVPPIVAQNKQYTLDDMIPGGRTYGLHSPQALQAPVVTDMGVLHFKKDSLMLYGYKGKTLIDGLYMTGKEWQQLSGDIGQRPLPYFRIDPETREAYTQISTYDGPQYVVFDLPTKKINRRIAIPQMKAKHTDLCLRTGYFALSDGHNLFVSDSVGHVKQITKDGSDDIVYGMPASRNEFGIEKGTFWSPSGRYLAFYRIDQTKVKPYPLVHITRPVASMEPLRYPMAGQDSQAVTIGIYDTQSDSLIYLHTGAPKDRYFTNLSWHPHEMVLYIDEVTRDQKLCKLVGYDVSTGKPSEPILVESNPKYIEPLTPILFVPNHSDTFIRRSRVNGYEHLYLYRITNGSAKLVRQLTDGAFEVSRLVGTDLAGRWAYYTSNEGYPLGSNLYRVSIPQGRIERLTNGKGTHYTMLSPSCKYALDLYSSISTPLDTRLISLGRKVETAELITALNPDSLYAMPQVRLGSIKANDGTTDLYYKITTPPHMETGKKYPVVVYVYGGPHAQLVKDSWNSLHRTWDCYMAQQGYIVFTLDNRGSENRGMAFESITHNRLGTIEMQDQVTGINYLKSLPYVDADRIGVHGWSFGGFMTTDLMLTHPEIFKVGVAGGPVMDWALYEVMYGERYMSIPQDNPRGYQQSNLIERAGDLKGRLLLIHGSVDPVVVWQHSLEFLNAAIKHRVMPDYMVYPEVEHNVIGPDRVQLYMVISRYFDDHLK